MHLELPIKLFFSYASEDRKHVEEIIKSLEPLKELFEWWDDSMIRLGQNWDENIRTRLAEADILLYFVSRHSLSSSYIQSTELKIAFEKVDKGEGMIIPIIVSPCQWTETKISSFQAAPYSAKPIINWPLVDDAYHDVVNRLKTVAREYSGARRVSTDDFSCRPWDKTVRILSRIDNEFLYNIEKELSMSRMYWKDIDSTIPKWDTCFTYIYCNKYLKLFKELRGELDSLDSSSIRFSSNLTDLLDVANRYGDNLKTLLKKSSSKNSLLYSKVLLLLEGTTGARRYMIRNFGSGEKYHLQLRKDVIRPANNIIKKIERELQELIEISNEIRLN